MPKQPKKSPKPGTMKDLGAKDLKPSRGGSDPAAGVTGGRAKSADKAYTQMDAYIKQ